MKIYALLALPLLLAEAAPEAKAPPKKAPTATTTTGEVDRGAGDLANVNKNHESVLSGIKDLAALHQSAKDSEDIARARCIKGWKEKADNSLKLATADMKIIRDGNATAKEKALRAEKMKWHAVNVQGNLETARKCSGDQSPEDEDDQTRNSKDVTETVPVKNPTQGGGTPPVPPPADPNLPTSASSGTM